MSPSREKNAIWHLSAEAHPRRQAAVRAKADAGYEEPLVISPARLYIRRFAPVLVDATSRERIDDRFVRPPRQGHCLGTLPAAALPGSSCAWRERELRVTHA